MYDSIQPLQLIKSLPDLSIAFLNPHTGAWDEELVRATLWQENAEVILSIPVHEGMEDTIAWHYNKNGIFSARSAYKVQIEDRRRINAARSGGSSFSGSNNGDQLWKKFRQPMPMLLIEAQQAACCGSWRKAWCVRPYSAYPIFGLFGFFFSQNSIFLAQQFSWNSVFQSVLAKFQTSKRGLNF